MAEDMSASSLERVVLEFLKNKALRGRQVELTLETPLQGLLTSNTLLALLELLENDVGVEMPIDEFVSANFKNAAAIVGFVEKHRAGAAASPRSV